MKELLLLAYEIAEVVIPLAAIPFVARDHRPHVAIGWLVLIAFLPLTGLAAYVYFGWLRLRHDRGARDEIEARLEPIRKRILASAGKDSGDRHLQLSTLVRRVTSGGSFAPIGGNSIVVLEGDATIDRLIQDIERAKSTVHLLYYLYSDDEVGRRVGSALGAAARRGVSCRLLVGSISAWLEAGRSVFSDLAPELEDSGVEIGALRPVNPLRNSFERVDLRNHRKLAIIDGRIAYTGSQNIHESDCGLEDREWMQLNVRVEGPAAAQIETVFLSDWYRERELPAEIDEVAVPEPAGDATVQILASARIGSTSVFRRLFVAAIHEAHEDLLLCTPYLIPDEAMQLALEIATLRGVRVRIVMPEKSDKWYVDAAARAYLDTLVPAGVEVYLYPGDVLHSKALVIDRAVAYVGSANLDRRSMFLDNEAGVLFSAPEALRDVQSVLDGYVAHAHQIDPEAWEKRARAQQYVDHCCKLLSPLL